jgi:hypothetical protein
MRAHVTAALNEAQDNGVRPLAAGTATGLARIGDGGFVGLIAEKGLTRAVPSERSAVMRRHREAECSIRRLRRCRRHRHTIKSHIIRRASLLLLHRHSLDSLRAKRCPIALAAEGSFRIFMRGNRCLMFLQAPAIFEGKRSISLIEVTGRSGNIPAGDLLSELYGPKDSERGLCSFRGGKFKTNADCTLTDYFEKSDQM